MLYWAFRLMFSRRLRWTINFANGALGAVGSERQEIRRKVNRSTAVFCSQLWTDVLVHCKGFIHLAYVSCVVLRFYPPGLASIY